MYRLTSFDRRTNKIIDAVFPIPNPPVIKKLRRV